MQPDLPIADALPALRAAMAARGMAVLQAPPGAGKTTLVPLDLLAASLVTGRIVMLQPRRLAARTAAERMAQTLGEAVGQTVGYRIRGEAKVSRATRIEVVTEGILTRMIQSDPGLAGVGLVIFDEFHERSLAADLGLAFCLEVRGALRDDLQLLVMSATLDAAPVAALMGDAPLITSAGRAFAVETRWLSRSPDPSVRHDAGMAALVRQAWHETTGGILAFLPGEGEIRRVASLLGDLPGTEIRPLYGAMDLAAQRAALGPVTGRKIVLATSIAETSLTIPDIGVVVDGGRSRRSRFDPSSGMAQLVTERVTKAEADQRRGRAGRVAAGVCYRYWTKGEDGGMAAFPPPEIVAGDLTGLALELALWGRADLPFLTPPSAGAMAEARALLAGLGALDGQGRITDHGRALAVLPLHPRLAHMLAVAGPMAATLAALMADRDPLRGAAPDLDLRLKTIAGKGEGDRVVIQRIRDEARRLTLLTARSARDDLSIGQMAALAYPDRIGLRRAGEAPRWLLSGGKEAVMQPGAPLSMARLIVATDLDGDARAAQVRQAVALSDAELRDLYADRITRQDRVEWSPRDGRVVARRKEMFGALVLDDQPLARPDADAVARAAVAGLRETGLPWSDATRRLRARIALARDDTWPAVTDAALLATAEDWLLPALAGRRTLADLRSVDLTDPLRGLLSWEQTATLDRLVPAHFDTPLGRRVPIDYDGDVPAISVRLQEMFGLTAHPVVGAKRLPLRITLLSPGQHPLQVTMDLPGFWATSYADVRRDMRGRYPRHPWPEDPTRADPTTRAKPRGT
jgi:ATP-dependent helicase HrpB